MSVNEIGSGPSNLVPRSEFRDFLAASAITKGQFVTLSGATGYTIAAASDVLCPIGVAAETAAAGDWIRVCVAGFCDYITNDGTDITENHMLYPVAAGVANGAVYGTDVGITGGGLIGIALQGDAGTVCQATWLHKRVADAKIPCGPGNLVPDTEYKQFLCTATVVKGDVVTASGTTGAGCAPASNILPPIGVAAESGLTGDWIKVITAGFCDYVTVATGAHTGEMLYAVAGGDCTGAAYGTHIGTQGGGIFGIALQDHATTVLTAAHIFKRL
jgi:hypothetical protein